MSRVFEKVTYFDSTLEEVFDFFSKAENLNKVTPSFLNFKILSSLPIEMKKGTLIDYKIKLQGINFKWKTEITDWQPNKQFTDNQIKGPYKQWTHTHLFEIEKNKVKMTDRVEYLSPGWIFEPILDKLFIRKKINEIFEYRTKILNEVFKPCFA
jgi:ligand-binding SRPBCC domain-containing protein